MHMYTGDSRSRVHEVSSATLERRGEIIIEKQHECFDRGEGYDGRRSV